MICGPDADSCDEFEIDEPGFRLTRPVPFVVTDGYRPEGPPSAGTLHGRQPAPPLIRLALAAVLSDVYAFGNVIFRETLYFLTSVFCDLKMDFEPDLKVEFDHSEWVGRCQFAELNSFI